MYPTQEAEPSALNLKAAYRLMAALDDMPERIEDAIPLIEVLRYTEAVSLIERVARAPANESEVMELAKACEEFVTWARK